MRISDKPSTADDGRIVLTTETRSHFWKRIFLIVLMSGIGAYPGLLAYNRDHRFSGAGLALSIAIWLFFSMGGLWLTWLSAWGTWIVTSDFIDYSPLFSSPRRLYWRDLVKLKWHPVRAIFQGSTLKISLPWNLFPTKESRFAKSTIKAYLSDDFDLTDPSVSFHFVKGLLSFATSLRRIGIGIAAIAIWLGFSAWLVRVKSLPELAFWFFVTYAVIFYLCIVTFIICREMETRLKSIHPEWPWRLRRPSSERPMEEESGAPNCDFG